RLGQDHAGPGDGAPFAAQAPRDELRRRHAVVGYAARPSAGRIWRRRIEPGRRRVAPGHRRLPRLPERIRPDDDLARAGTKGIRRRRVEPRTLADRRDQVGVRRRLEQRRLGQLDLDERLRPELAGQPQRRLRRVAARPREVRGSWHSARPLPRTRRAAAGTSHERGPPPTLAWRSSTSRTQPRGRPTRSRWRTARPRARRLPRTSAENGAPAAVRYPVLQDA